MIVWVFGGYLWHTAPTEVERRLVLRVGYPVVCYGVFDCQLNMAGEEVIKAG